MSANALTYEKAFDTNKAIPNMKGVDGTEDRDDLHKKGFNALRKYGKAHYAVKTSRQLMIAEFNAILYSAAINHKVIKAQVCK